MRQIRLFYRHAHARDALQSAARLADVNAAFCGGQAARERMRSLQKAART